MLLEALHEVVNVLSALFNTPGAPHSKLNKLVADGEEVPGDIVGMLAGFNRLDLALEVPGYGKGGALARPAMTLSSSGRHRGQEPFPLLELHRRFSRRPSGPPLGATPRHRTNRRPGAAQELVPAAPGAERASGARTGRRGVSGSVARGTSGSS